jgi:CubicO group peptidase (beta-lactamase class C family)
MDNLTGLWGSERIVGPEIRGELTLTREGPRWRADIAGFGALAASDGGTLLFAFPGGRGEFRGALAGDSSSITGHWVQPRRLVNGTSYATPVQLQPAGSDVWRGQVVPLDDRIALYLAIEGQPGGADDLTAFIRDPERNSGLRLQIGKLSLQGDELHLPARRGEIVAKYDQDNDTLTFMPPGYSVTLDFTRRGPDQASGFYPRTPRVERYDYRPPLAENDGWPTGSLAGAGLDPTPITALVEHILHTETTGVRTPYIQGLLIARHGKLVLEEYFYGFHKERPHDTRSASKSFTALLAGIAIDRGTLTLASPAHSLFPEYPAYAHDDPRKRKITVEHLLTMTSGLECDDNDDSSAGNEDNMQDQEEQPDWYKYTLDLPMVREPGEQAVYCSAGINLLGGIVSNATATWLPNYFHEHVAQPLDFHRYYANLTPLKNMYGGGGLYLRPRDFMKLGQLFVAGGRWNDRQVISQTWVDSTLQPHSYLEDHHYGYGWHLGEYQLTGQTYPRAEAGGNGGQFAIIIPTLDLVIMFTAANYGDYPTWTKFRDDLVPNYIIPAATH